MWDLRVIHNRSCLDPLHMHSAGQLQKNQPLLWERFLRPPPPPHLLSIPGPVRGHGGGTVGGPCVPTSQMAVAQGIGFPGS